MAHLNPTTGMWEDDASGPAAYQPGELGAQAQSVPDPQPLPQVRMDIGEPTVTPVSQLPPVAPPPPPSIPPPQMEGPGELPGDRAPPPAPPQVPPVTAYQPPAMSLPQPDRVVSPQESANLGQQNANMQARATTEQQGGQLDTQGAQAKLDEAQREQAAQVAHQAERQQIVDTAEKRTQALQQQAQADWQKYRAMGIKDPHADESFGHKVLAAIAIGLGQYSAAMNHTSNAALGIIEKAAEDNIARQKDAIAKAFDDAKASKESLQEAQQQKASALKDLDLKHSALLDSAAAKLKTELARIGVPAAQVAANADVQKLEAAALDKREEVLKGIRVNEVELAKADIAASAKRHHGGGGGGGGPAAMGGMAELSQYAIDHPGDQPGLYKLAAQLGIPKPDKAVAQVINQTKGTESQTKNAQQGKIASSAIDAIEASGYQPSKAVIQKWLNNQREVGNAEKLGSTGLGGTLLAGLGQKTGIMAQSETEGLPEGAKDYFSNVRRYMESIGRAQSGAAISPSEWTNFYNQYGPNSKGGLKAAKEYAETQSRAGGVVSKQLDGGTKAAPAKNESPQVKLAREAIADPEAPPAVKARALQILRAQGL